VTYESCWKSMIATSVQRGLRTAASVLFSTSQTEREAVSSSVFRCAASAEAGQRVSRHQTSKGRESIRSADAARGARSSSSSEVESKIRLDESFEGSGMRGAVRICNSWISIHTGRSSAEGRAYLCERENDDNDGDPAPLTGSGRRERDCKDRFERDVRVRGARGPTTYEKSPVRRRCRR
jgi:hypothetical protein